ncbi:hypothetical protein SAY86_007293 [Trapa natans]|uniref:Uncharacterized protein n=1 Tax=Trapa natans TaxID=22666 RepID=A0AAN7LEA3_TRANT|nr:hypothetical protein SAY86_007293 [Trapa natans]
MVAEPWILKMRNQVSSNLKQAFHSEAPRKKTHNPPRKQEPKQLLEILSFEVANVMSKTIHLHKSLSDSEISRLKNEISKFEGVTQLVSSDQSRVLELALAEKLDELNRVAGVISRLGRKCTEPALQGFEHVYGDIVNGLIDVKELGFLVKDMGGMIRRMERYVSSTLSLYNEMEVLSELEQATKKFHNTQHEESRRAFEQKLSWQRQDVRHLREVSLWSQTYDKAVEMLARTACTIYARICVVFGEYVNRGGLPVVVGGSESSSTIVHECLGNSGSVTKHECHVSGTLKRAQSKSSNGFYSSPIGWREPMSSLRPRMGPRNPDMADLFCAEDFNFPCVTNPGRIFMDCLSLSSSISRVDDGDDGSTDVVDRNDRGSQLSSCYSVVSGGFKREIHNLNQARVSFSSSGSHGKLGGNSVGNSSTGPKSWVTFYSPQSTIGGSALALHYANLIIVIEKLLRYPHLVGDEARDDLYQMLPLSLRASLKTNLKAYMKSLAIYDAPLAHEWKERVSRILRWLTPLAHNMMKWQSERNFEQHQIVTRTNVLLVQTLYFADRDKIEKVICELLVGLNYICRYEHQQIALLDCGSSLDFEECLEWQMQCSATAYPIEEKSM